VASDEKRGVSTKLFALRGSKWSQEFLDLWFDEQKATFDCERAEGAFLMAIVKKTLGDAEAVAKCGVAKNDQENPPKEPREFWARDHKSPLVSCLVGALGKKVVSDQCRPTHIRPLAAAAESSGVGKDDAAPSQQHSTFPLPVGEFKVTSDCMLSDAVFASKDFDADHTWIRFGPYDAFNSAVGALGSRF
jgi:hypothetical protein